MGCDRSPSVAETLATGPGPSGLRPRSPDAPPLARVEQLLAELSPAARAMLEHVVENGGEATTGSARLTVSPDDAATPAEELLSRRLLVPKPGGAVVQVPGEVGLALRGGRTTTEPVDEVPPLATTERSPALVDRAGAGAAFDAVRRVELLLDQWGAHPPGVLRSGGLGVRDLKAAAALLAVDEPTAALVVETAHAAGLLASRADADGDPVWVPTDAFDTWAGETPAERWLVLVRAWLDSPRLPGLVGSRDAAGKAWNALAPELASWSMAEARAGTLAALARAGPRGDPGRGHRTAVAGRAGRLAPAAPTALPGRAGDVDGARGRHAGGDGSRRAAVLHPRPARRRRRGGRDHGRSCRTRSTTS